MPDLFPSSKKRVSNKKIKDNYKMALKEACILYSIEQDNGMSAQHCCDVIEKKYNTTISKRTVQHYVEHNKAGKSPRKGLQAYKSYVRIKQINAETAGNTQTHLSKRDNNSMNTGKTNDVCSSRFKGIVLWTSLLV